MFVKAVYDCALNATNGLIESKSLVVPSRKMLLSACAPRALPVFSAALLLEAQPPATSAEASNATSIVRIRIDHSPVRARPRYRASLRKTSPG